MDFMFWVWLGVIVVTAAAEFATMELVSIWFTAGAIVPFILSATNACSWVWQVVIFGVVSAALMISLRGITKKFLLRNSNAKTNLDTLIGREFRMLSRTDFETLGSLKVNDVVWSARGKDDEVIEKGEVVKIVKIQGNKLIVTKAKNSEEENASQKVNKKD